MKRIINCLFLMIGLMLSVNNIVVYAAEFDPDYYAANNPDVVATLGEDPSTLFIHYQTSGINENRLAYEGAQPGEIVTFDVTEGKINLATDKAAQDNLKTLMFADLSEPDDLYFNTSGVPFFVRVVDYNAWSKKAAVSTWYMMGEVGIGTGAARRVITVAEENGYYCPLVYTQYIDSETGEPFMYIDNSSNVYNGAFELVRANVLNK